MKKILFITSLLFASCIGYAQADLSGAYGYSFKPAGNPPEAKKNAGPSGTLVLLKMEGNKYRFWLDITTGWPNYHVGETDGTIVFVNDSATFSNEDEVENNPCILNFKLTGTTININSMSTSFNCEFGVGVNADGDYARLATQPVLNNEWLFKEYHQSPQVLVTAAKAEVFKDEKCQHSYTPAKHLTKNDTIVTIAETDKSIYTEYITSSGKFIYGWVKKAALEIGK